jgi:hypothetical protein
VPSLMVTARKLTGGIPLVLYTRSMELALPCVRRPKGAVDLRAGTMGERSIMSNGAPRRLPKRGFDTRWSQLDMP